MLVTNTRVRGISHFTGDRVLSFFFGGLFCMKTRSIVTSNLCKNEKNMVLKSNKNVFISPEFELWTRAAGRIFEKNRLFLFKGKGATSISDLYHGPEY